MQLFSLILAVCLIVCESLLQPSSREEIFQSEQLHKDNNVISARRRSVQNCTGTREDPNTWNVWILRNILRLQLFYFCEAAKINGNTWEMTLQSHWCSFNGGIDRQKFQKGTEWKSIFSWKKYSDELIMSKKIVSGPKCSQYLYSSELADKGSLPALMLRVVYGRHWP